MVGRYLSDWGSYISTEMPSVWNGTMEGALLAGRRATEDVLRVLNSPSLGGR
jgi:monoamine oxidase